MAPNENIASDWVDKDERIRLAVSMIFIIYVNDIRGKEGWRHR
jgi:hypothetical protein